METISTKRTIIKGFVVPVLALSLAALAAAQARPVVTGDTANSSVAMKPGEVRVLKPMANRVKKWTNFSTTKFFPQIARTVTSRGVRPSNPEVKTSPRMTFEDFQAKSRTEAPSLPALGGLTGKTIPTLASKFPGISFSGSVPPDVSMAVGPTHVVQVVNSNIAFYNKNSGQLEFFQPLSSAGFLPGSGSFVFDPRVVFDTDENQFVVVALDVDFNRNESYVQLAFSDDANPHGNWKVAKVDNSFDDAGGNPRWGDYPTVTTSQNSIVLTFNHFPFFNGSAGGTIWVIRKSDKEIFAGEAGAFSVSLAKKFTPGPGSPVGISLSFPFLFFGVIPIDPSLNIFGVLDEMDPPQLALTSVDIPVFVRQAEGAEVAGFQIDTIGDRMMDVTRTADDVLFAFTCNVGPDADGYEFSSVDQDEPLQTKVRWGELDMRNWPNTALDPTVTQVGDVGFALGTKRSVLMPAIAKNTQGSVILVATECKDDATPKVIATSRIPSDPLGAMSIPEVFASSPNFALDDAEFVSRWGDYAGVALDPQALDTFWGSHEIFTDPSTRWGTEIFKLRVKTSVVSSNSFSSVTPIFGSHLSGNIASFVTLGDSDIYKLESEVVSGRGNYAGYEGVLPTAGLLDGGRLNLNMYASIDGVSGFVYVFNYSRNRFDLIATPRLKTVAQTIQLVFTTAQLAAYRAPGTGDMLVRAVALNTERRKGLSVPPFEFGTDLGLITINEL